MSAIKLPKWKIDALLTGRKKTLEQVKAAPKILGDVASFSSFEQLQALAGELDVPVREFFDGIETDLDQGVKIGRKSGAFSRTSERNGKPYYTYHHLATTKNEPSLMALRLELHCTDVSDVVLNDGHGSKEVVYVTRGKVRFDWRTDQGTIQSDVLDAGDSVYVSPRTAHSFSGVGGDAEIIAVNY